MTIADLERRLGCQALIPYQDVPITGAYTSDMLSDVMAHAPEDSVLVTLQAHKNTVACATLAGIKAVVLGRCPRSSPRHARSRGGRTYRRFGQSPAPV